MFLLTLARLIAGLGALLAFVGIIFLFAEPGPSIGIWSLIIGIVFVAFGILLRKAQSQMLEEAAGPPPIFRRNSETQEENPSRARLYSTFEVSFGFPMGGKFFLTRDEFGFKGEGILFIDDDLKKVELSGERGRHFLIILPLKLVGKIPLWGNIFEELLGIEFERRTTFTISKSEIRELTRSKRTISFIAPTEAGGGNLKRTSFMAHTETAAQDIERALSAL